MNLDKWQDIKSLVENKFGFERYDKEDFEVGENDKGQIVQGRREIVEFDGPLGLMKLEFEVSPVVLDKKVFHSARIGSESKTTYIYSDSEVGYKLRIYKFDNSQDNWIEIEANNFLV